MKRSFFRVFDEKSDFSTYRTRLQPFSQILRSTRSSSQIEDIRGIRGMPNNSSMPTLSDLCLETIAGSIEKYPPQCFAMLAEPEWEEIIRKKHRNTAPGQNKHQSAASGASKSTTAPAVGPTAIKVAAPVVLSGGLDGKGRTVPALTDKILQEIEWRNPHLARSTVADTLVWKDCVEYKFKKDGMSRPRTFRYPWPILVERLRTSGENLLGLLGPPPSGQEEMDCSEATIRQRRERILLKSIQILGDSIMTVPLLAASGVGKSVKKFVKECNKLVAKDSGHSIPRYMPNVLTARPNLRLLSPLQYLENLLNDWKAVASSSGVIVSSKTHRSLSTAEQYSGRSKKTTEQQHRDDMAILETCLQWRDLHQALTNREAAKIAQHGEKMRKLREDLDSDRPKIGKVGTAVRSTGAMKKQNRQDAILSKSKGTRAIMAAKAKASGSYSRGSGTNKIQTLRQEAAFKKSRQGAVGSSGPRSSKAPPLRKAEPQKMSFGASVASYSSSSKRPDSPPRSMLVQKRKGMVGSAGTREVKLGGGKKMALPRKPIGSKSAGGIFTAIAEKKRKAAAMEAYKAKQRRENDLTPRFKK